MEVVMKTGFQGFFGLGLAALALSSCGEIAQQSSDFVESNRVANVQSHSLGELYAIKKPNLAFNCVDVDSHVYNTYTQKRLSNWSTGFCPVNVNTEFKMADWDLDGRPDLIGIAKSGTVSRQVEIQIASGASNFRNMSVLITPFGPISGNDYQFEFGYWDGDQKPDLFVIQRRNTGSNKTEVHILSGASNYSQFILQTGTVFNVYGDNAEFKVVDYDLDGRSDLVGIAKYGFGLGATGIYIASGSSGFQSFILQTTTGIAETNSSASFEFVTGAGSPRRPNLIFINESSNSQVYAVIYTASSGYKQTLGGSGAWIGLPSGRYTFATGTR
jgi:hypothetical protein